MIANDNLEEIEAEVCVNCGTYYNIPMDWAIKWMLKHGNYNVMPQLCMKCLGD
jgi:MinD superfamily P-loop ATPase